MQLSLVEVNAIYAIKKLLGQPNSSRYQSSLQLTSHISTTCSNDTGYDMGR